MMKLKWQDKFVFYLINRVHDEEFVWNHTIPAFKHEKQQFFLQLADEMNTMFKANVPFQYDEITHKWNNLKSYFAAEKQCVDNAKRSGAPVDERNPWKFFDALKFLIVVNQQTESVNNFTKKNVMFLKPLEDETDQSEQYISLFLEEESDTELSNSAFEDYSQISTRKRCATDPNSFDIISDIRLASPPSCTENSVIVESKTANSCKIISNAATTPQSVSTKNSAVENRTRKNHAVKKRRTKTENDVNENASALIEASQNLTHAFCAASKNEKANIFGAYIAEEIAKLEPELQVTTKRDIHNILVDLQIE